MVWHQGHLLICGVLMQLGILRFTTQAPATICPDLPGSSNASIGLGRYPHLRTHTFSPDKPKPFKYGTVRVPILGVTRRFFASLWPLPEKLHRIVRLHPVEPQILKSLPILSIGMAGTDPYAVLGISRGASNIEVSNKRAVPPHHRDLRRRGELRLPSTAPLPRILIPVCPAEPACPPARLPHQRTPEEEDCPPLLPSSPLQDHVPQLCLIPHALQRQAHPECTATRSPASPLATPSWARNSPPPLSCPRSTALPTPLPWAP